MEGGEPERVGAAAVVDTRQNSSWAIASDVRVEDALPCIVFILTSFCGQRYRGVLLCIDITIHEVTRLHISRPFCYFAKEYTCLQKSEDAISRLGCIRTGRLVHDCFNIPVHCDIVGFAFHALFICWMNCSVLNALNCIHFDALLSLGHVLNSKYERTSSVWCSIVLGVPFLLTKIEKEKNEKRKKKEPTSWQFLPSALAFFLFLHK